MTTRRRVLGIGVVACLAGGLAPAVAATPQGAGQHSTPFEIPAAMKAEHEKLHADLLTLTKAPGRTGEAATRVAAVLHDHFVKEEELALPPLGLLAPLAAGHATPEMQHVIVLTDRLKAALPQMINEHKAIVRELDELGRAAKAEHNAAATRFVEELTLHAQTEEQVLYPAAVLVGEYLKLKLPHATSK